MGMKLADMFVRIGADVSGLSRGLQKAQKSLGSIGASMQKAGMAMTLAITAPMVGVAAAGLKLAASFEAGMNKVAAVTGATGEEFEALEAKARELGKTTKFTAGEAADAMGFLGMAGMETDDIMGSMADTLNLAAAANIDLATSADVVTNILKGFGLETEQLAAATDTLATVMSSSNTDLLQLGEAFKMVGPVAAGVGLRFNEMAAAIGLLGNAGIQGSMAGTSLRKIITSLLGPTKEGAKVMKKYGISVVDAAGNMMPMADIIDQFTDGFERVGTAAENSSDMMTLIGVRGGPAMISIVNQGADALRDLEKKADDAAGAVKTMAEVMMKGLQGSVTKMQSALQDAGISLGQILAPHAEALTKFVIKLANKFSELATKFKELPAPIQRLSLVFAAFVTALGPVLMVTGFFLTQMSGFKLLVPTLAKVGAGFTKFGGVLAKLAVTIKGIGFAALWTSIKAGVMGVVTAMTALSGGTLLLVIAGIVALGLALAVIIKHWINVKDVMMAFGRDMAKFFASLWKSYKDWIAKVVGLFGKFGMWVAGWVDKIFGTALARKIKKVWDGISSYMKGVWKKITGFFEGGFGKIVGLFAKLAGKLGLEETERAFENWKIALDLAGEAAADFVGPISDVGPIAEDVVEQLDLLPPPLLDAGEAAEGFARALDDAGIAAANLLEDIPKTFDELVDSVKKAKSTLLPFWQSVADKAKEHRKAVEAQILVYDELGVVAGPAIESLLNELTRLDKMMAQIAQRSLDDEFVALNKSMRSGLIESTKVLSAELQAMGGILDTLADDKWAGLNKAIEVADSAMKQYGITSTGSIFDIIDGLELQRLAMEDSWAAGTHSAADYWRVVIKSLEKQIDLTSQLGLETEHLEAQLSAAGDALAETGVGFVKVKKKAGEAGFVMKQVSTIVTDLSRGLADAILEGENFGEIVANSFEAAGKAVLRFAIETVGKELMNSLLNAQGAVAGLSKAFDGLMSGITKLIGGGGGGGAGGGGGGGGAMGMLAGGPLGMLGSLGTMVSSIIGNFQNAKMEKTMNAIEENTRYIKIWTGEEEYSIKNNTAATREGIGYLNASTDDIKKSLWEISETLNSGIFVQDTELKKELDLTKRDVVEVTERTAEAEIAATGDVVASVDTSTQAIHETRQSVDVQTNHIDQGFDELKSVQERGTEILRELGSNVDSWGSVMDEVASGMVNVATAVQNQTRSLNQLMGGGAGTVVTVAPDVDAIQVKQLFYLRYLENLDVPLSNALAFLERAISSQATNLQDFQPIAPENVSEYESLQKELVRLQKKERKTYVDRARIQDIQARLIKLDTQNNNATSDLQQNQLSSNGRYATNLNTSSSALDSGSNRLVQAGMGASKAIDTSFATVAGALTTGAKDLSGIGLAKVGQITSGFAGALQTGMVSPFGKNVLGQQPPPAPGISNTGVVGISSAPAFWGKNGNPVYLSVEVNNADAKKVADTMIGTWRSHGVDI